MDGRRVDLFISLAGAIFPLHIVTFTLLPTCHCIHWFFLLFSFLLSFFVSVTLSDDSLGYLSNSYPHTPTRPHALLQSRTGSLLCLRQLLHSSTFKYLAFTPLHSLICTQNFPYLGTNSNWCSAQLRTHGRDLNTYLGPPPQDLCR